jgi:fucose permease
MSIGRYTLGAATEAIGLRTAASAYIVLMCCAQFLFMEIDHLIGSLVLLGVCGFFLAPLFPSGIVILSMRTPPNERTRIVAAVIAMGQVGGAIVPYGLGLLATYLGTQYFLRVTLGLSVVLLALWIAMPRVKNCTVADEGID